MWTISGSFSSVTFGAAGFNIGLSILGLIGVTGGSFTSTLGRGWIPIFLLLRLWVGPSLFESSAKVEAVGVTRGSRFWGKLISNLSLEVFGSFFLVSTIFTSWKAFFFIDSFSNHFGLSVLVGISSILENMILPFVATFSQSIISPGLSFVSLQFSITGLAWLVPLWGGECFSHTGSEDTGVAFLVSVVLSSSAFWSFLWSAMVFSSVKLGDNFLFFFFLFRSFDLDFRLDDDLDLDLVLDLGALSDLDRRLCFLFFRSFSKAGGACSLFSVSSTCFWAAIFALCDHIWVSGD